ncbi:hypothetical protein PPSIR1_22791 [Plesiocystis pacifica SIR-1]|uniref:Uncharacterized protein n=1 Tax=Plesiocystis pacifica SIR-1 TaxID=391625 RepID=A6G2I1_9BACT|nr:hypothetical protein [Plesiocystis pacifica]EDM79918.1 hypothetical protein PPSIR1_22791 [Plesiocystis pacifica SIR-1]
MDQFVFSKTNLDPEDDLHESDDASASSEPLSAPPYEHVNATRTDTTTDTPDEPSEHEPDLRARLENMSERARAMIRKHPLRAVGGAFTVGVAVGSLTPGFLARRVIGASICILTDIAVDKLIPRLH